MKKDNKWDYKKQFLRKYNIYKLWGKESLVKIKKGIKHKIFMNWTWPKKVFLGIMIIVLLGSILLYTPLTYDYSSYQYVNNEYIFQMNMSETDILLGKNPEYQLNFVQALFLAVSAFTDTGLTAGMDLSFHLNFFGQFVIYTLIQIGGFGYISLFYLLGRLIYRTTNKNVFSKSMLHIERGGSKISQSSKMIVRIFFIILALQFIFAIIVSTIIYSVPFYYQQSAANYFGVSINDYRAVNDGYHNYGKALWHGVFLVSSAMNNAGFDLLGSSSLAIFRNDAGISIQFLLLILLILGGIGFPVIYDISCRIEWFIKVKILARWFNKTQYLNLQKEKFSNFSKVCLWSYFIIAAFSIALAFLTEYVGQYGFVRQTLGTNPDGSEIKLVPITDLTFKIHGSQTGSELISPFGDNVSLNMNWAIIFNTLSTRSAGFSTVNLYGITESTKVLFIILMFIGACPSSNGGGIRTTTVAVMAKSMFSWLRGMDKTSFFKRSVPKKTVTFSFLIFFTEVILISAFATAFYYLSFTNDFVNKTQSQLYDYQFIDYLFDMASAFGTTGLSTGVSSVTYLDWWALLPLIVIMLVGQLGMGATIEIFARKIPKRVENDYLEEDIKLG